MFFGTAAYTAQCVGYVFLKKRYKNIPRTFRSPLGVAGAGVAICVFTLCALSILVFQDAQTGTSKAAMVVMLAVLSMYYHLFAKSRQTISDDEQKLLFFAHVGMSSTCIFHVEFVCFVLRLVEVLRPIEYVS
ncbi:hypothetical protein AaE_000193 [Aphanomyces astaci]|uniref:Amino acid permease/ SLC12A domain-containing protein n=1 Tax=Aphanomyces astaci TaxID=112090 RepID=A0A6A5AF84_APHAT|nr:hypothetical protein AaE_000193 [Aphanomyces astaci]